MFNLTTNYFVLFGIDQTYDVDSKLLKSRYLELQRQTHPDNFAIEPQNVQRESVQRVAYLNQAYDTLKSPLKRAIYMLQTAGQSFDPETQIQNDPLFLMQQMQLREALAEVSEQDDPLSTLDKLREDALQNFASQQRVFAQQFEDQNWLLAATEINKMMFSAKLLTEINEQEEILFD